MNRSRRPVRVLRSMLGSLLIVAVLLPASASSVAAAGASVPNGFQDETIWSGLDHPMAVAFAPNGQVFVAEKRGTIRVYDSLADTTPTTFADLNINVDNYWDRGMMGLAVDPGFPTRPYVYVLYAYNHILGDPAPAPRWPVSGVNPWNEVCPNPPAGTTDGCVVSGRLSRLTSSGGVMSGSEHVLIEDWCQQFPSHSLGSLMFGPEGALYVSAGDGASFNSGTPDYGQLGGTLTSTPTPVNPCGDPGGSSPSPPSAEGGALRSQDIRTTGDPTGLDGAILRVNPDTGAAWPTNANIGSSDLNARRIIAYGLRNPYRFTIKPGTDDVWVGDVGFETWEELNRLTDPNAAALNFGWPCYEGNATQPKYQALGLSLCSSLSAGSVTAPYFAYNHSSTVVNNDGCGTGSSSIAGLAFLPASSSYPSSYDNGLFFTDYSRRCIWFMPAGSGGQPNTGARTLFANLVRPGADPDGGAVFLTVSPAGDLIYADYDLGEVRRIRYFDTNVPPVASFSATPSNGAAPLTVAFDASGSSDPDGQPLTYAWDLDGDGAYDDGTGVTIGRTYTPPGDVVVGLRVTDTGGASDTTTRTVAVGNSPPTASITAPASSLTWQVGQTISFSGTATDAQDGTLPASAFEWALEMIHCPSNCHTHVITNVSGTKSGTFDAPDHEYPSHLRLKLTVTDSGGLSVTKDVEIQPKTGTVSVASSPSGIPVTAATTTGIVGSTISVTAPQTAIIGEGQWAFQSWSDGGARTHGVPVVQGATPVTATYALTSTTDRSDSCSGSPAPTVPNGSWSSGRFARSNDVDWYRFKLTSTTRVRLILGNLSTGGKLQLYSGCSRLLQTSDRAGNGAEEIIRNLSAGTYAIKLSGSGTEATPNYLVRIVRMSKSVHVLSYKSLVEGGTLRLVGEVYNNTTRNVGAIKVTAKLYNASNKLLTTRAVYIDLSYVVPNGRGAFRIVGSLPSGYHHVKFTVSAPVTKRKIGAPAVSTAVNEPDADGHWHVAGTVRNQYSTPISTLRVAITLYDGLGSVMDVARAAVGANTLGVGKTTTFDATFIPVGQEPDRVYVRGMLFR